MNFATLSQLIIEAIKALTNSLGCKSHVQGEIENLKNLLSQGVEFLRNEHEKQQSQQSQESNGGSQDAIN